MTQILSLLTAFGLGSIVTVLVQSWFAHRSKLDDRRFQQKQAAYVGLLEAWREEAVNEIDGKSKAFGFGYWHWRCELVGSPKVRDAISRILMTNEDPEGRSKAIADMKDAMRSDLNITQ